MRNQYVTEQEAEKIKMHLILIQISDEDWKLCSQDVHDAELAMCGDCKEFNQYETETGECMKYAQTRWKDDFCNYGKRRKND